MFTPDPDPEFTALAESTNRWARVRLGVISYIDTDKGVCSARWIDGEPGQIDNIPLPFPNIAIGYFQQTKNLSTGEISNNLVISPWGSQLSFDIGMVGLFAFLKDNHPLLTAIFLPGLVQGTSATQTLPNQNPTFPTGYKLLKQLNRAVAIGENRTTSKAQADIYEDQFGNVHISSQFGKINIVASPPVPSAPTQQNITTNVAPSGSDPTPAFIQDNSNAYITIDAVTGSITINGKYGIITLDQQGINIKDLSGSGISLNAGHKIQPVLYSLHGSSVINSLNDIGVSTSVYVDTGTP